MEKLVIERSKDPRQAQDTHKVLQNFKPSETLLVLIEGDKECNEKKAVALPKFQGQETDWCNDSALCCPSWSVRLAMRAEPLTAGDHSQAWKPREVCLVGI